MAAEFEEVVVGADLRDSQHLRPDVCDYFFHWCARGHVGSLIRLARSFRRGQRLAVHFAIRGQRKLVENDERPRHHVVRQLRTQVLPQVFHGCRLFAMQHGIPHQPLLAGLLIFPRQHYRLFYRRVRSQGGFDLSQLNAEAAHLHLIVAAAQKLDVAVLPIARQIAGAVHARAGIVGKGILQEAFRRHLRLPAIAAAYARAADVEFSHCSDWHRLQPRIQDVHARIGDRAADGNRR